jgi:hypothetical protein
VCSLQPVCAPGSLVNSVTLRRNGPPRPHIQLAGQVCHVPDYHAFALQIAQRHGKSDDRWIWYNQSSGLEFFWYDLPFALSFADRISIRRTCSMQVLNLNPPQQLYGHRIIAMAKADRPCVTAVLPPSSIEPSPRGIKRSRSPDQYGELAGEDDGDGMWNSSNVSNDPASDATADHALIPRHRSCSSSSLLLTLTLMQMIRSPGREADLQRHHAHLENSPA